MAVGRWGIPEDLCVESGFLAVWTGILCVAGKGFEAILEIS